MNSTLRNALRTLCTVLARRLFSNLSLSLLAEVRFRTLEEAFQSFIRDLSRSGGVDMFLGSGPAQVRRMGTRTSLFVDVHVLPKRFNLF